LKSLKKEIVIKMKGDNLRLVSLNWTMYAMSGLNALLSLELLPVGANQLRDKRLLDVSFTCNCLG